MPSVGRLKQSTGERTSAWKPFLRPWRLPLNLEQVASFGKIFRRIPWPKRRLFDCTGIYDGYSLQGSIMTLFLKVSTSNGIFEILSLNNSIQQPLIIQLLDKEKVLQDYKSYMPNLKYVDLQQYPSNNRGRGETSDGCLCTLTTNSCKIFSQNLSLLNARRIWQPLFFQYPRRGPNNRNHLISGELD